MKLSQHIINANNAYRTGFPIMSDAEYDVLLAKLEDEMNFIEFETFKQTLTEVSGEIRHPYIIGSLNKLKYGESELEKWLAKYPTNFLFVSEKIDGCSFVADYENGELVMCASRGDGYTGSDWLNKAIHILPKNINCKKKLSIRGEFTLTGDSYVKLGMKNLRNGTIGVMGNDTINPTNLGMIKPFVYEILNSSLCIKSQFELIQELGFVTPFHVEFYVDKDIEENLKGFYEIVKENKDYNKDGLVISSPYFEREDKFLPLKKVAFKVNSEGVKATVTGIEWKTSKQGSIKPVVLLTPTEIDGTTVKRATGYNAQYIKDNHIGVGAEVLIIKSGEIIPKIISITKISNMTLLQVECPSCHSKLSWKGVDLVCSNQYCSEQEVLKVASFLKACGVENASEKSLKNWGIVNFKTLLNFVPDMNYKSQVGFMMELKNKVFNKSDIELFANMVFDGGAKRTVNKILTHYGVNNQPSIVKATTDAFMCFEPTTYPDTIGQTTLDRMRDAWMNNIKILKHIMSDPRYIGTVSVQKKPIIGKLTGKTFCITGTLSKGRKHFEDLIVSNGGTIASVSKSLDYLLTGADAGSKLDKANKLGVRVIVEGEFNKLI